LNNDGINDGLGGDLSKEVRDLYSAKVSVIATRTRHQRHTFVGLHWAVWKLRYCWTLYVCVAFVSQHLWGEQICES